MPTAPKPKVSKVKVAKLVEEPAPPPPTIQDAEFVLLPPQPEALENVGDVVPRGGAVSPKWSGIYRPWAARTAAETGATAPPGHVDFEAWLYAALEYYDRNVLIEGPAVLEYLAAAAASGIVTAGDQ